MKPDKSTLLFILLAVLFSCFNLSAQDVLFEDNFDKPKKWVFIDPYYMKFKKGKLHVSYEFTGTPSVYPQAENPTSEYDGFYPRKLYCAAEVTVEWVKYKGKETSYVGYGIGYHPYSFEIKPDGSYQIYKYNRVSKTNSIIFSSEGKPVEGINPGAAVNKIKVERNDNIFLFYCNDKLIKKFKSNEEYRTLDVAFTLLLHGPQELSFDNYSIRTVPPIKSEEQQAKEASSACNKGQRNFDETMYDGGLMKDEEITNLAPEKQLLDFFSQYGICMKINPLWIRNRKNVIGSTITAYGQDLKNLSATFPAFSKMPGSLHLTLALNSRTLDDTKKMYENIVHNGLKTYLRTISKELTDSDWENNWKNRVIKTENFTTTEGKQGIVYTCNVHNVIYVDPTSLRADLTSMFNVVAIIPQPDNKVIQCTVQFENKNYSQSTMPANPLQDNVFTPAEEMELVSFLKVMFKSITQPIPK